MSGYTHNAGPRRMTGLGFRVIAVSLLTSHAAAGQSVPSQKVDVPVKSVMLFSSGVGYFEHAGTVRDNVATELRFKTSQINDILKSLVIRDQDGGRISAISYPSQDPVDKTLRSFQVDITRNPSLADLLNQLRGARVSVRAHAEQFNGVVLGVETRRVGVSGTTPAQFLDTPILNLLSGANIRSVELPTITALTLEDERLQDELSKALTTLSQSRDQDKKPVTINFQGVGERRVRLGYVVETPVWKTSYRLLLDDKLTTIQGWAIVENQTESDWNGVSLSLVSGRPMSFKMDLYQPLYASRPTVTQELFAGLRPQQYEAGTIERASVPMSVARLATENLPSRALAAVVVTGAASAADGTPAAASLLPAVAAGSRMGELFQFNVNNVTLARQKSAMLPIIGDTVTVDRLSIYNASVLSGHPLNGVRLHNKTGKHLLQGPVTVLDKGAYAGDAQLDNVPPGQERLLSYGVDLDVQMSVRDSSTSTRLVTGRVNAGTLIVDYRYLTQREYRADNKSDREKRLVIEHPIRANWKLVQTANPVETTASLYRFEGAIAAHKLSSFVVREESVQSQYLSLLNYNELQFAQFTKNAEIPQAVRAAIAKAGELHAAIAVTDKALADRDVRIADITAEQARIRDNMRTVQQNTAYYQRLLEKLNEQESQIETLQRERSELQTKRDAQRKEYEAYVSTLNIS